MSPIIGISVISSIIGVDSLELSQAKVNNANTKNKRCNR